MIIYETNIIYVIIYNEITLNDFIYMKQIYDNILQLINSYF